MNRPALFHSRRTCLISGEVPPLPQRGRGALISALFTVWLLILTAGCSPGPDGNPPGPSKTVRIAGRPLEVEFAASEEQRLRGLGFRQKLEDDHGMLFCWAVDHLRPFSTPHTMFPLSVAFCAADGRIQEIRGARPYDIDGPVPANAYRYALAAPEGWFDRNSIRPGALAEWDSAVAALDPGLKVAVIDIAGHPVRIEIANTAETLHTGLMHRPALPPESGMIFVYRRPEPRGFWMKNTLIPLAIAFFNDDGVIQEIRSMKPHDETTTLSRNAARFALEMNVDWFDRQNVKPGDRIALPPDLLALPSEM